MSTERAPARLPRALASYLFTEHAQKVVTEGGFRPISPSLWTTNNGAFAPFKKFFDVADFGRRETVNVRFLGKGGLWARLLNPSR